ncbi:hypothetical protein NHF39_18140 [Pseudomonas proteolytica]|nr:hypothetical protein [Pseudomonas proteolytica]USW93426.1 hypothetical protein NHF39_18140 [Pseudomonas proteolytica]USX02668.1 hypothetical protein NHF41_13270 [Pseudomonas proteolytica]
MTQLDYSTPASLPSAATLKVIMENTTPPNLQELQPESAQAVNIPTD